MTKKDDQIYYLTSPGGEIVCTTVGRQNYAPGESYPSGKHPQDHLFSYSGRVLNEYQIVYITDGRGWFSCENTPLTEVDRGTAFFLSPGEKHLYYPDKQVGWKEFWVGFTTNNESVRRAFSGKGPLRTVGLSDTICRMYEKILSIAQFEKIGSQDALSGFIVALLGYMNYLDANKNTVRSRYRDKVEAAQILIRENVGAKISPESVAQQLGISYSLLREKFKDITGMSMSEYLTGQRLSQAKSLLLSTDKTVSEVAFETGYDSLARFCCAFKKYVGTSATQWREVREGEGM